MYFGDNYFHEHKDAAKEAIVREVDKVHPDIVVVGPAFNAGRYGLAAVEICQTLAEQLGLRCVAGMEPENPGVNLSRDYHNDKVFLLPTAETAAGMGRALSTLAPFACRLAAGEAMARVRPTRKDTSRAAFDGLNGRTDRASSAPSICCSPRWKVDPSSPKCRWRFGITFEPAPPVQNAAEAKLAVVSTSGVVPWGNPDGFKTYRNTSWRKYNFVELKALEPGKWEAVHGGYNVADMNRNPHYGIPLDALRALEAEGKIGRGKLYPAYYMIPGNQGSPTVMRRVGQEIAADLTQRGCRWHLTRRHVRDLQSQRRCDQ